MIGHALLAVTLIAATAPTAPDPRCASTKTADLVACAEGQRKTAESDLQKVEAEVRRLQKDNAAALASFGKAEKAWRAFLKTDCQAVYNAYGPGESELQFAFCRAGMTQSRASDLWKRFVQGTDSTLPAPPSPCDQAK